MKRIKAKQWAALTCLCAAVLALSACGGSSGGSSSSGGGSEGGGDAKTVDVYSSLPLQGASKGITSQIVNGIKLALEEAHGEAGGVKVEYTSLDDSTPQAGTWDPGQVAQNARQAVEDSNAIAYIGEFNSGASAVAIPLTNQGELAEISPTSTYVGLTTNEPGSEPGEPEKYYPTGKRTFARIVPRDSVQAAALVSLMRQDSCHRVAIANDLEAFGVSLAQLVTDDAKGTDLTVVSNEGIQKESANFRSYAEKVAGENIDCFLFSGVPANGGVSVMKAVGAAVPEAKLYAPDGTCEAGFTNPAEGGLPAELGKRFKCTNPARDLSSYPGGKEFVEQYSKRYGTKDPDPYSIYGYAAMQLVLHTIEEGGTERSSFLEKLFQTKDYDSVLGKYSINADGDTSLNSYGVYGVGANGEPEFLETIEAGK
ncbi:MAG: branched-chain amino acid ABC transporter substrate-binding protein [Actinobacteria bacterium]|nr:branched-chain amino acid ABC transporter substrate-binding protein [Actinomycetota bacterium]